MRDVAAKELLVFALCVVGCASGTRARGHEEAGQGGGAGATGTVDAGAGSGAGGSSGAGGGTAGGSSDASDAPDAVDAAPDTADAEVMPTAACAGVLCEDFESGQIDPARWTTTTTNGATFTLQQQIVAHGKYAVQFHGNANLASPDYAYLIWKGAPATMAKHNFGRAYFYVTPKPRSNDMGMIFGGTAGFPKPTYLSIANHASGWQLGFIKLSGSPTGEVQAYPSADIPVGRWTCLEWEFNDAPTSITMWVDGKVVGALNDQDVAYPPGHAPGAPLYNGADSDLIGAFTDFGVGYYDWHPQGRPAFDLYYDDIVLGTTRPGCLPN